MSPLSALRRKREESRGGDAGADIALLAAAAAGDAKAREILYRGHCDAVFRFIYRRVGENYEDAAELTQDTFLHALKLANTFDGSSSVFTWLCGIARIRVIDHFRHQNRDKRSAEQTNVSLEALGLERLTSAATTGAYEQALERIDAERLVSWLMDQLHADEREVLLLKYVEELSVREISAVLKRSEKATESLLSRAKARAKQALAQLALAETEREGELA